MEQTRFQTFFFQLFKHFFSLLTGFKFSGNNTEASVLGLHQTAVQSAEGFLQQRGFLSAGHRVGGQIEDLADFIGSVCRRKAQLQIAVRRLLRQLKGWY